MAWIDGNGFVQDRIVAARGAFAAGARGAGVARIRARQAGAIRCAVVEKSGET